MLFVTSLGAFPAGNRSTAQFQTRCLVLPKLGARRTRRSRLFCARSDGDDDISGMDPDEEDRASPGLDAETTPLSQGENPLGVDGFDSDEASENLGDESADEQSTSNGVCSTCNGDKSISCTNCNAFGFLRVDAETVWRTCHICFGRGILICPTCQPSDAVLPNPFQTDPL